MSRKHFEFWPNGLPHDITAPATNLFYNAEVSATRYPDKPFLIFFEGAVTFRRFKDEAERLAGFLQQDCGVARGDRVLLVMQNSPQFIISYYAILRANAIVVPVNPMSVTAELAHYVEDSGAKVGARRAGSLSAAEAAARRELQACGRCGLRRTTPTVRRRCAFQTSSLRRGKRSPMPGVTLWSDALARETQRQVRSRWAPTICASFRTARARPAAEGLHAHASQRDAHADHELRLVRLQRRTRVSSSCCRSSTSPACRAA